MLRNTVVDYYNINLINYIPVFEERAPVIVDELYDLNLLIDDNVQVCSTVRTAITHHFIDSVCKTIIDFKSESELPVFITCDTCYDELELSRYLDLNLGDYIGKLFKKMNTMLGVNYIVISESWSQFIDAVHARDGDVVEQLQSLSNRKPRDLNSMYKFVQKHGLKGIKRKFFQEHKYKQVFI
jgi:hypothetical protein